MKQIFLSLAFLFIISCASYDIVKDKFDNSTLIKLEKIMRDFEQVDGKLQINNIIFSKEYNLKKISDTKLFCKFIGYNGEFYEGKYIEINIDGAIYKLNLIESRLGNYEKINSSTSTTYTLLGAFTYSDATRSDVHIIVTECILPKDILNLILKSKSMMIRFYTKNIDGISKNTYELPSYTIKDIKEFINYIPEN